MRLRTRRKKRLSMHRGAVAPAAGRNQHWSMDFAHDQLVTGRAFRVLTVIDQWSLDYNDHRPHGALGHLTPSEYAERGQTHSSEAAVLELTPV